jgi:hypothetical protein
MATPNQKLFAIIIAGYKKEGMNKKKYHEFISKTHAGPC